jgi:aminoglycoside phosphotransferase (APT) family kinase protein
VRGVEDLSDLTPLAGGWSGHTFLAEAAGERSVVRIYPPGARSDAAPEIDAAVLHLVRGLVPVPDVLEVRRGSAERPGLLVTSYLSGERGDLLLPTLDDEGRTTLGRHLGHLAATLAGMPTLKAGPFVDHDLAIGDFDVPDGLPGFVDAVAASLDWEPGLLEGLRAVADRAQRILDSVRRSCLVHSDLNPKNLLVDPETLAVTGVVDWEFAHSGHPYTDLGNLLRFDRDPTYQLAVVDAWCERRGDRRPDALELARNADLWALVDLASRAGQNPVADRAERLLRGIAAVRDPHA